MQARYGVLFVLQVSKNVVGTVICEVLLFPRYPIVTPSHRAFHGLLVLCEFRGKRNTFGTLSVSAFDSKRTFVGRHRCAIEIPYNLMQQSFASCSLVSP